MKKEEIEKKAQKHKKDFAYTICMHNSRIRKSGAQIALESYLAGYYACSKDNQQETAIKIIKELLGHCRALKVLVHEDVPKLNKNIAMAEKFLSEVE